MADDSRRSRALKHSRDEHDYSNRRTDDRSDYTQDKRTRYDRDDSLRQGNSNYARKTSEYDRDEEVTGSNNRGVEYDDRSLDQSENRSTTSQRLLGSAIGSIRGRTQSQPDYLNRNFDETEKSSETAVPKMTLEERKSSLAKLNPDLAVRNRRMFGSLMGHLGLAKQKLEKDSSKINKQLEYEKSILQKKNEEMLRNSYAKQKEAKENWYKNQIDGIQSNALRRKAYFESLESFLFTSSEPRLSWLPAHISKTTTELLSRRHDEV